ncbi:DUF1499 domain-containing protein [Limobrevibacterium gyesilva]|uniref:DUF1499 domain-containing protein n=1 Tax=Limobrevibacterium gyesilva TaxID=2991712 RepID=A0AA41YP81_9PROT|nr:DUF1499 domain-containing protein [Limobrevibacterium gyesilva]MCW3475723.1 DUF1499 domain-containing protein [Limobrevibacterium gyesilva]
MTRLLPLLLGLLLPACSGHGAEGLPVPPPMDMTRIERPATPNTALAAPAGFTPAPDIATRRYDVPPARLYAAIRAVAAAQPRTFAHAAYDDRLQAHYVARSALLNFPDLIAVQVTPESGLILWSRSVYGRSDFGVNRRRVATWLAALDAALAAN